MKTHYVLDTSTLVLFYNQFYIGGSLLFHMRRHKCLSEDLTKKICQTVAATLDSLHKQKKLVMSRFRL